MTTTTAPAVAPKLVAPTATAPPTTAVPAPSPPPTAPPTTQPQAPNTPPVAVDDSATTTAHAPVLVDLTANDSDPDGDGIVFPVTVSYPASTGKGANVNLNGDGHTINYVPNNHQLPGPDTFQYTVCDARGGCSTANVTVTVT
jgi:hypothetical protein